MQAAKVTKINLFFEAVSFIGRVNIFHCKAYFHSLFVFEVIFS